MPEQEWSEIQHYAWIRRGRMDPDHPNTKALAKATGEVIWNYLLTHTDEQIADLQRRVERDREARHRLFGRPRPIVSWEVQRQWTSQFGLSVVLGYELEDPC